MSFWTVPTVAAKIAVAAPTIVTRAVAVGLVSNIGDNRQTMNTPAVTIVAAWIRAETGVGPSIASGSQVWRGSWADLAKAPTRSSRQIAVTVHSFVVKAWGAFSKTSPYSKVPSSRKIRKAASTRPMSPTTLITKAFIPAPVAVARRYQKLI